MPNDWHKVVDLNPRGRAEIHSSSGEAGHPELFRGIIAAIKVTCDDLVEIRLEDGKPFIFPNGCCPFEIEHSSEGERVRFATAYQTEINGRPELGFAPNYLYLRQ